jgi:ElaB/YqjD/DUF883 family membrane-anchored ribosome-binding protein
MSQLVNNATRAADDASLRVRQLRNDVESLMRDVVTPALTDAVAKAVSTSKQMQKHSETVASNVRGRPLLSVSLAGLVGFIFGRATR